ncbi:MAG: O-antigen ligase family protein [Phycisphaeraceae bacterium]|nr:MAG: O-antigen ligase family protein [Phycisphaeraceae bacterium]
MSARSDIWRRIAEGLLLAYVATLPAGALLPTEVRNALIYGVALFGVLDAAVGPPGPGLRGVWPVGVFLGVHVLTIFTSEHRSLSLGLSVFMPVVAMMFVVSQRVLVGPRAIGRLYAAFGFVAAAIAIDGAVQAVFRVDLLRMQPTPDAFDRVHASLPHPNDLVMVPILLPFLFESLRALGRKWLVAGVLVIGPAVAITLVASKSRNAWLTMAGVLMVWSLLVLGWRWALGLMGLLGGAAALLYALDFWGLRARVNDFLRLRQDGRVGLWLVAWAMFKDSPWLGKGVFTFGEYYHPRWYSLHVRFPRWYTPEPLIIPWAHNLVLEMLGERGLVGLASFVWMIGAAVASVGRRLLEPRTAAAATALAGFLGAGLLDLTLMKDWVALLLFLLLALLWRLGAVDEQDVENGTESATP